MSDTYALALPRKRFFLEMFTRDISLQDCILDLIDNSIDGLIRSRQLNLDAKDLLNTNPIIPINEPKARIQVSYTKDGFSIQDNCGGIDQAYAEREVFNFGHAEHPAGDMGTTQLGAYGIGLKRAIFKIGDHFEMTSHTAVNGFRVKVDVAEWSQKDDTLNDWRFPLDHLEGAMPPEQPGTTINIARISPDIQSLFRDPTTTTALHRSIAQTYASFLTRYVDIILNGMSISPTLIPLGASENFTPAVETWDEEGVHITLIAGLAARGESNEWRAEPAGWYVLCNGRVILAADKTELTGWGAGILPQFHTSVSRGFIGIASFSSRDPLKLPWTTTKRSLNREAAVFLRVRERMASIARPVYSFLNSLSQSKSEVTSDERKIMTSLSQADLGQVASVPSRSFNPEKLPRKQKTTASVRYNVNLTDLEKVREHLRRPSMPPKDIGRYTFDYFLKQEGVQ
ncbi:MAG TPA: ATP-binding protein [Phycisphaerae bacterium]|nr:ATP-binding protein [Phycisphaerae bacterium]